jgi:LEA14-like dessication related protein
MTGFYNFGGATEIVSLKVVGGTATYIDVELVIALNNPSQITITAGDLNFNVHMDASGSQVGTVFLTNTVIKPGRNEMAAKMQMTSSDLLSLSKMLTNYLTGQVTALSVKGSLTSTKIIPLQPGLSQVNLKTEMKGIAPQLVVENQMKMVGLTPNIWVKFYNPLDTPYTVTGVAANVFFTNKAGAYMNLGTLSGAIDPSVTVPPKGTALNENPLILKVQLASALQFLALPADQRKVDLFQNVTVVVGEGFHGAMYYEQKNVPVVDKDTASSSEALAMALKAAGLAPSNAASSVVPPAASSIVPPAASSADPVPTTTAEAPAPTTEAPAPTTDASVPVTTTEADPAPPVATTPETPVAANTPEAAPVEDVNANTQPQGPTVDRFDLPF